MTLSRQVLRKIDDRLRSQFDQEKGEWMAKVPISGATKVVWQRYCQAVGVDMGAGVALLILDELSSIAGEEAGTLADRLKGREADLNARAQGLKDREKELRQRDRVLFLREAGIEDREKELAAREQKVAIIEQEIAPQLRGPTRRQTAGDSKVGLGRNDRCWCGSGKKYKVCHLSREG